MLTSGPIRPASQVTLKTVFTVCFAVLAVTALVFFVLRTQVSVTLTLAAAMAAIAMNHAVDVLIRLGLRRKWAVPTVIFALVALAVGSSVMLIPPVVSLCDADPGVLSRVAMRHMGRFRWSCGGITARCGATWLQREVL